MARVLVEGDAGAVEQIKAVLHSAGLTSVDVEWVPRAASVAVMPPAPVHWAAFADHAPGLTYVDWRDEVLSLVGGVEPTLVRPGVTPLRKAG